jgi:hypothetical protein
MYIFRALRPNQGSVITLKIGPLDKLKPRQLKGTFLITDGMILYVQGGFKKLGDIAISRFWVGEKSCVTLPLTFSKDPFVGCFRPFLSICVIGVSLELLSTEVCMYCCS